MKRSGRRRRQEESVVDQDANPSKKRETENHRRKKQSKTFEELSNSYQTDDDSQSMVSACEDNPNSNQSSENISYGKLEPKMQEFPEQNGNNGSGEIFPLKSKKHLELVEKPENSDKVNNAKKYGSISTVKTFFEEFNKDTAACKICRKRIRIATNVYNLFHHMRRVHPRYIYDENGERLLTPTLNRPELTSLTNAPVQDTKCNYANRAEGSSQSTVFSLEDNSNSKQSSENISYGKLEPQKRIREPTNYDLEINTDELPGRIEIKDEPIFQVPESKTSSLSKNITQDFENISVTFRNQCIEDNSKNISSQATIGDLITPDIGHKQKIQEFPEPYGNSSSSTGNYGTGDIIALKSKPNLELVEKPECTDKVNNIMHKRPRALQKSSMVWNFFDGINKETVVCKICKNDIKFTGGSLNLSNHIRSQHSDYLNDQNEELQNDTYTINAILKKKSMIWSFFEELNKDTLVCKICNRNFKFTRSVSNLYHHMRRAHGNYLHDRNEEQLQTDSSTVNSDGTSPLPQTPRDDTVNQLPQSQTLTPYDEIVELLPVQSKKDLELIEDFALSEPDYTNEKEPINPYQEGDESQSTVSAYEDNSNSNQSFENISVGKLEVQEQIIEPTNYDMEINTDELPGTIETKDDQIFEISDSESSSDIALSDWASRTKSSKTLRTSPIPSTSFSYSRTSTHSSNILSQNAAQDIEITRVASQNQYIEYNSNNICSQAAIGHLDNGHNQKMQESDELNRNICGNQDLSSRNDGIGEVYQLKSEIDLELVLKEEPEYTDKADNNLSITTLPAGSSTFIPRPAFITPSSTLGILSDLSSLDPSTATGKLRQTSLINFDESTELSELEKERIDYALIKMVVEDFQLSVLENNCFLEYSYNLQPQYKVPNQEFLCHNMLPMKYQEIKQKVSEILHEVSNVAVTTDMWTSDSNRTFLALTSHFIFGNKLKSVFLSVKEIPRNHTADNVTNAISTILNEWAISAKVVTIVTDNNANIKKAIENLKICHHTSVAHTLNLCVTEAIKRAPEFCALLNTCRTIVAHFKHSTVASDSLKQMQKQMELPELKVKYDVATRWNSSLIMLDRLLELKQPLSAVIIRMPDAPKFLNSSDWDIIRDCTSILRPLELMTKELSAEKYITISSIIPLIRGLQGTITQEKPITSCGFFLRSALLDMINRHLAILEFDKSCAKATFLDARFKHLVFSIEVNSDNTKKWIIDEIFENINKRDCTTSTNLNQEKTIKGDSQHTNVLLRSFMQEVTYKATNSNVTHVAVNLSVEQYLNMELIDLSQDTLEFWNRNKTLLPELFKLSQKYLCIPASSVPSEIMFSKAGDVINERRNRLEGETLNQILFLNSNLEL